MSHTSSLLEPKPTIFHFIYLLIVGLFLPCFDAEDCSINSNTHVCARRQQEHDEISLLQVGVRAVDLDNKRLEKKLRKAGDAQRAAGLDSKRSKRKLDEGESSSSSEATPFKVDRQFIKKAAHGLAIPGLISEEELAAGAAQGLAKMQGSPAHAQELATAAAQGFAKLQIPPQTPPSLPRLSSPPQAAPPVPGFDPQRAAAFSYSGPGIPSSASSPVAEPSPQGIAVGGASLNMGAPPGAGAWAQGMVMGPSSFNMGAPQGAGSSPQGLGMGPSSFNMGSSQGAGLSPQGLVMGPASSNMGAPQGADSSPQDLVMGPASSNMGAPQGAGSSPQDLVMGPTSLNMGSPQGSGAPPQGMVMGPPPGPGEWPSGRAFQPASRNVEAQIRAAASTNGMTFGPASLNAGAPSGPGAEQQGIAFGPASLGRARPLPGRNEEAQQYSPAQDFSPGIAQGEVPAYVMMPQGPAIAQHAPPFERSGFVPGLLAESVEDKSTRIRADAGDVAAAESQRAFKAMATNRAAEARYRSIAKLSAEKAAAQSVAADAEKAVARAAAQTAAAMKAAVAAEKAVADLPRLSGIRRSG